MDFLPHGLSGADIAAGRENSPARLGEKHRERSAEASAKESNWFADREIVWFLVSLPRLDWWFGLDGPV